MNQPQPTLPDLRQLQENVPETLHPVLEWMGKNSKLLIVVISAIIVVVAAYSVTKMVIDHRSHSARQELAAILLADGPVDVDTLAAFAAEAPDSVALRARFELAKAKLDAGDFAGAAGSFAELASSTDPDVRTLALMSQARCLILDNRPDEALQVVDGYRAVAPEAYSVPLTRIYAAAAEAAGKTAMAVTAYQELLSLGQGVDTEFLLYKLNQLSADTGAGS